MNRIKLHPILETSKKQNIVRFKFDGMELEGYEDEPISSSLFANNIKKFGSHFKDHSPQGIFCANGQCAQCTVIVDGKSEKACMTPLKSGMDIKSAGGEMELSATTVDCNPPEVVKCDVLIVGAGPAGLSAAILLGKYGIDTLVVDDKSAPGGKLLLQTHCFFGSKKECYAGTRGIDIAKILTDEALSTPSVRIWTSSPVIATFRDHTFGVNHNGIYTVVEPKTTIIATGAREKPLSFPGCDLPGVYGAGAFQTLLNRDLVRPCKNLFIVGAGNVGLIAAYHALQADISVMGIAEAAPKAGGYEVHYMKLKRQGIPFYFSHTVKECIGDENGVREIVLAEVDSDFKPIENSEKVIPADTVLIAAGLSPIDELLRQAEMHGTSIIACGDAKEIAEASAAMFSGKLTAAEILKTLGVEVKIPNDAVEKFNVLKQRPGKSIPPTYPNCSSPVHPVIHCFQEIPCDPCCNICRFQSIQLAEKGNILSLPKFDGKCMGCMQCINICPGLAIVVVDRREVPNGKAKVVLPYEMNSELISKDQILQLTDRDGNDIGEGKVLSILNRGNKRKLVTVLTDSEIAEITAGFKVPLPEPPEAKPTHSSQIEDSTIVCRCERVTAGEIRKTLRSGIKDIHGLKALLRCTMGACGGKTCGKLLGRLFMEAGLKPPILSLRPLDMESSFSMLAGGRQ